MAAPHVDRPDSARERQSSHYADEDRSLPPGVEDDPEWGADVRSFSNGSEEDGSHERESQGPYSIDGRDRFEGEYDGHSYGGEGFSVDEGVPDTEPERGIPMSAICHEARVLTIVFLLSVIQGAILLPFLLLYAILVTLFVVVSQCIRFHDRAFLHIFYSKRVGPNVRTLMVLAVPVAYVVGSALLLVVVALLTVVFSFAEPFFLNSLNLRQQVLTECEHVVTFLLSGVLDSVHVANKYLDAFVFEFFTHSIYSHMRRFSDQFYDDEPVEIRPGYFLLMIVSGAIFGALQAVNFLLIAALGAIPAIVAGYAAVVANPEQFGLGRKQVRHKVCKFFGRVVALILWPVVVVIGVAVAPLVGFGLGCKSGWVVYFTTSPRWNGGGLFLNNYPHDVYKLPAEIKQLEAEEQEQQDIEGPGRGEDATDTGDAAEGEKQDEETVAAGATVSKEEPLRPRYKPLPRGLHAGALDWWADVGFAVDTSARTVLNQPPGRPLQFPLFHICRCDEATRDPHACRGILAALVLGLVGAIAMPIFSAVICGILGLPTIARSFAKAWEYFRPVCSFNLLRQPGTLAWLIFLQVPGFLILLVLVIPAHAVLYAVFVAASVIVGLQAGFRAMEETESAWTRGMLSIGQTMRNIDHELIMYIYDTEDRDVVPCTLITESLLLKCEEDVELDDEFDRQIHAAAALGVGPRYIGAMWTPEGLRRTDTLANLAHAAEQAGGSYVPPTVAHANAVSAAHVLPPHRRDKDQPAADPSGRAGEQATASSEADDGVDADEGQYDEEGESTMYDSRAASFDGPHAHPRGGDRGSVGGSTVDEDRCCLCCACFAPDEALRDEIPGLREMQEARSRSQSRSRSRAPSPAPSRTSTANEHEAVDEVQSQTGGVAQGSEEEGAEAEANQEGNDTTTALAPVPLPATETPQHVAPSPPDAGSPSADSVPNNAPALASTSSAEETTPSRQQAAAAAAAASRPPVGEPSRARAAPQTVHEWPSDSRGALDEPSSDDGDDSDDSDGSEGREDRERAGTSGRSRMHERKEGEDRTDTSEEPGTAEAIGAPATDSHGRDAANDDVIEVVVSDDEEGDWEGETPAHGHSRPGNAPSGTETATGTGVEAPPPSAASPLRSSSRRAADAVARAQRLLEQSRRSR